MTTGHCSQTPQLSSPKQAMAPRLFAIKSYLFFLPTGLMLLSHMPESAKEKPKPDPACRAKHWRVIVKLSLMGEC